MKDQLFILRPGFFEGGKGPFYCGDSVSVEGLLSFFPTLRTAVDVNYADAQKPRADIVALIGEANQSAPVIVLSPETVVLDQSIKLETSGGLRFIDDPPAIRQYLSSQFGVPTAA